MTLEKKHLCLLSGEQLGFNRGVAVMDINNLKGNSERRA